MWWLAATMLLIFFVFYLGKRYLGESRQADEAPAGLAEPVEIPIGPELDLHTFSPSEIGLAVDAYLEAAAQQGLERVKIIHGKGSGQARAWVRDRLEKSHWVERYEDAPPPSHWGATIAYLRPGAIAPS